MASKTWKERIIETGVVTSKEIAATPLVDWSWEKMQKIFGEKWWSILSHCKNNNLKCKNIVAVTAKDTRKTTVWIIFMWFLLNEYEFLNAFLLRDTIDRSQSEMRKQLNKGVAIATNEWGVANFQSYVQSSGNNFYLVRDKRTKTNQSITMASFDSIQELGGFTTNNGFPAICIHDELQNRNSSLKPTISDNDFLANYKFIDKKLENIERTTQKKLPEWIPRHVFLSNRYVNDYPLNNFAEKHFPYYESYENDKTVSGVKEWMLEDIVNNNFIFHHVSKENVDPFWSDFADSVIVYANTLSNHLLTADSKYVQEVQATVANGKKEDLAYYTGDLFEGYGSNKKAYQYSLISQISADEFRRYYAQHIEVIRFSMDIDFSRQIVLGAKYQVSKKVTNPKTGKDHLIYRLVRDRIVKIKCRGLDKTGNRTMFYIKRIYEEVQKYIHERIHSLFSGIPSFIYIVIDDKKAFIPGLFNYGEFKDALYQAWKVNFDKKWPRIKRPSDISAMQDSGFLIDIMDPSLTHLHTSYSRAKLQDNVQKGKAVRIERDNDPDVDLWNWDEYGVYHSRPVWAYNNLATQELGGQNVW